jgi:hypothetical protein
MRNMWRIVPPVPWPFWVIQALSILTSSHIELASPIFHPNQVDLKDLSSSSMHLFPLPSTTHPPRPQHYARPFQDLQRLTPSPPFTPGSANTVSSGNIPLPDMTFPSFNVFQLENFIEGLPRLNPSSFLPSPSQYRFFKA